MNDDDIEILASENAINNLKKPSVINDVFETIKPPAMQDVFNAKEIFDLELFDTDEEIESIYEEEEEAK